MNSKGSLINRRHLRLKVLHLLYAFEKSESKEFLGHKKQLDQSIEQMYRMYLMYLQVFGKIADYALYKMDEGKNKLLPSQEDLNPNMRLLNNPLFQSIVKNEELKLMSEKHHADWGLEEELFKKIYRSLIENETYKAYMEKTSSTLDEDKKFIIKIFKKIIAPYPGIHEHFNEFSIWWADDADMVCSMILKNLKDWDLAEDSENLLPLHKMDDDQELFYELLFTNSIKKSEDWNKIIDKHAQNWDLERIAILDQIILKMAMTEVTTFNSIPVNVTMNEYIEIAKGYSTEKSSTFVNGMMESIFAELREQGLINKIGRGLQNA